jgi:uncharacterized protein (TIGR02117 family)
LCSLSLPFLKTQQPRDVAIYIITNGDHTDIVVPVKTAIADWSQEIKYEHISSHDTTAQYLALGWGDKGFFLSTPTWADLKFSTAFKAVFGLSTSAIHATFYKQLRENDQCKKIIISTSQYQRLVVFMKNSFITDSTGHFIHIHANGYSDNDAFYESGRIYSLFYTCNTWANNALKSAGQKACLWTPFDKGIFYQYKKSGATLNTRLATTQ